MLSTSDNPYNPWIDYDKWYDWDQAAGYHTPQYIARLANTLAGLPDDQEQVAVDLAIASILDVNITGNYIMVPEPTV